MAIPSNEIMLAFNQADYTATYEIFVFINLHSDTSSAVCPPQTIIYGSMLTDSTHVTPLFRAHSQEMWQIQVNLHLFMWRC
jgi:uncharacterized membrane-anchored protein